MYTDQDRSRVHDPFRRQDQQLFAHLLTPELFWQAARLCGLTIIHSPLNLINLVWLALSAARNPQLSFAQLLDLPFQTLQDQENFPSSDLGQLLANAKRRRRRSKRRSCKRRRPSPRGHQPSRHDPRGRDLLRVSEEAFSRARQRMPTDFWLALFFLLGEQFQQRYGDLLRWRHLRLLAVDGTRLNLPDYPALRQHFGTASNASGAHNAQARLLLLQFPLARLPYAYTLQPVKVGESTLARQLLQGLQRRDLVLLDAGFRSYGVLAQIDQQGAFFCLRLGQKLNLKVIKELGSANDVEVEWRPKDSRGQWRKEGLPRALRLRRLTYPVKGYRPLQLLTNVLSTQEVPYECWWGLSVSAEGEVLGRGLYHWRWEIETTYGELKVTQQLAGGLRSRLPEGIAYEVAGHLLYYLLVRWLLVEAAVRAGVSPLRLSFQEALGEINGMWPAAGSSSAAWLRRVLRPRLRARLASHRVRERPGRAYPRGKKERRASKRRADKQAKQAKQAKARRPQKSKPRRWYGQGWDLSGPKSQPAATAQG